MFFSVIIPTYNPKEYLETLLTSILHNRCLNEIEVIISDDCSTEDFDDVIENFSQLNIRKIVNEKHYGFPRAGRQNGADNANGTWICFSDQDDYFKDNAFDNILKYIKKHNIKNCLFSNFIEYQIDTGKQIIRSAESGWTHGKFYEKEFWDKYNICYDEINYCEDVNLSSKIDCITTAENIECKTYDKPVYVWKRRGNSLADEEYFVKSLPEFAKATSGVIVNYVEQYKDNEELFLKFNVKFISTLMNIYFNLQSNLVYDKKTIMLKTAESLQPTYTKYKEITGFTTGDMIYYIYNELTDLYDHVRKENYDQIPFVEKDSIRDWLLMYFE